MSVVTNGNGAPLVVVRDLVKDFIHGALGGDHVRAVDGVSFEIMPGETFALVEESGSGKSNRLLHAAPP